MVKNICMFTGVFALLFTWTEILFFLCKTKGESLRKFVHVCTGLIALTFPYFFDSMAEILILCGGFVVVFGVAERFGLLKSITKVNRKSRGSYLFPIAVILLFFLYDWTSNYALYALPLLILTFADPIAAIVGQNIKSKAYSINGNTKSHAGSIAFFVTSLIITVGVGFYFDLEFGRIDIITLSVFTTIVEGISKNGWDNLLIPSSVALLMIYIQ